MAKKNEKLSAKEARFVDAFLGSCSGNATEACLAAGYSRNRKSAAEIGSRLLRKVKIARALKAATNARQTEEIADANERDAALTTILRGSAPAIVKISAIKELNKCTGRHSIKHLHEGQLTLAQAVAASRKPRP
jgi:phage terminase small subunit